MDGESGYYEKTLGEDAIASVGIPVLYPQKPRVPLRVLQRYVQDEFGLTEEEILSKTHRHRISHPRHALFYFARKYTKLSFPDLGVRLRKNHTTVLLGRDRIKEVLVRPRPKEEVFVAAVRRIDARIALYLIVEMNKPSALVTPQL